MPAPALPWCQTAHVVVSIDSSVESIDRTPSSSRTIAWLSGLRVHIDGGSPACSNEAAARLVPLALVASLRTIDLPLPAQTFNNNPLYPLYTRSKAQSRGLLAFLLLAGVVTLGANRCG